MHGATDETSAFDTVIEQIGNAGPYQKRFNYCFNFVLVIFAAMPHLNLIISLATPDHWCHIPGRHDTNFTLDEWKQMYIPMEPDSRGILTYSKCKRYNAPYSDAEAMNISELSIEKCNVGWDYDNTWYDVTAPMQNNWVCDDEMNVANTIAVCRTGEVLGTLIFGHLADTYGRRPVFFATVVTLVFGRVMSTMTSTWIIAFFVAGFVGNLPSTSVFQGPLVIAMEISKPEDRAYISMLQCFGWTVGMVTMPMLMWWLRDWVPFLFATSLPCALFLFSRRWMIESPRWLASQGKIKRCLKELETVAKVNKSKLPDNAEALLTKSYKNQGEEKNHNVLGLFSSPRLAKNSVLLVFCWTILLLIYMALTINVFNLGGNPFLNYLFQALAELPAYLIGKFVSDRYGRRWTSFVSFLFTAIATIPILFIVHDEAYSFAINVMCIILKFSISLAFYSVNLQSMEIYPTCVRQTGISVGVIFGSGIGVVAPYIINMGTSINAIIPYCIYLVTALIAAACCLFLPETYGQKLPETLADSSRFGADQDFWGRTKSKEIHLQDGAGLPLNVPIINEYNIQEKS